MVVDEEDLKVDEGNIAVWANGKNWDWGEKTRFWDLEDKEEGNNGEEEGNKEARAEGLKKRRIPIAGERCTHSARGGINSEVNASGLPLANLTGRQPLYQAKKAYTDHNLRKSDPRNTSVPPRSAEAFSIAVEPGGEPAVNIEEEVFGRARGYPTERRPVDYRRTIDCDTSDKDIEEWFIHSKITIGPKAVGSEEREARRLLYTWKDLFASDVDVMPPTDLIEHSIPTWPNAIPVRAKAAIHTLRERRWMEENIPKMIASGILDYSVSPWAHRTKFTPKKNGDLRMVHVYCPINAATITNSYRMRRIEPILNNLTQNRYRVYFQADAANGFWAVPLYPPHAYRTAFVTPMGQFHYLRMGQGLSGAPQTYTRLKDFFRGPIPAPHAEPSLDAATSGAFECFVDDDFGAHDSFRSQYNFLHWWYFPRLSWARLTLNGSKTGFFLDKIEPLGFQCEGTGLRASVDKVRAIRKYPRPSSLAEVEAFLYLTTYLRCFIPGRVEHARILKEAVTYTEGPMRPQKGGRKRQGKLVRLPTGFNWTEKQDNSFEYLKQAIIANAVHGGDDGRQYHLATDASGYAIGGVLFQLIHSPPGTLASPSNRKEQRIIMFISKQLTKPESRYSTTEREALAVLRCLEEVRWLVVGSPFPTKVYTDHQALVTLLQKDDAHGRIAGWQVRLSEYDVEYIHILGRENVLADGMSRMRGERMEAGVCLVEALEQGGVVMQGWDSWLRDEWYGGIVHYKLLGSLEGFEDLDKRPPDRNRRHQIHQTARRYLLLTGKDNRLVYLERSGEQSLCVFKEVVQSILTQMHDCHGHFVSGILTKSLIGRFYWPTRSRDVHYHCYSCRECQLIGPLKPLASILPVIQLQPLDMMGFDFIGPINPPSHLTQCRYIIIGVDYFTRYLFAQPVAAATGASAVGLLLDQVVRPFGWPLAIYTDNGQHFAQGDFPQLLREYSVRQFPAPKTHPSSVGLSERYVQLLMTGLRASLQKDGQVAENWEILVPGIVHSINTRKLRVHGFTPSELMFGFNLWHGELDMRVRDIAVTTALCETLTPYTSDGPESVISRNHTLRLAHLDEIRELAITRTVEEAARPRQRGVLWEALQENDLVLLRRFEVDKNKGMKLAAQWEGPYRLTDLSWHKRSGRLRDINTGEVVRVRKGGLRERCHVNDMKLFVPRENGWVGFDGDKQESRAIGTCFVGLTEYGRKCAAGNDLADLLWPAP